MRVKIFPWLGQEFVSLSREGNGEGTIEDETRELFARFSDRLREFSLSLDHTVRTRLWARDMDCWQAGVDERARILSGKARSVSSSHIRPDRVGFKGADRSGNDGDVPAGHRRKQETQGIRAKNQRVAESDLGRNSVLLRRIGHDARNLDEQFPTIVGRLSETLSDGGGSWQRVARASFLASRGVTADKSRETLRTTISAQIPSLDYTFIDTRQGKRLEIEITATPSIVQEACSHPRLPCVTELGGHQIVVVAHPERTSHRWCRQWPEQA